jgi:hypothetical protein
MKTITATFAMFAFVIGLAGGSFAAESPPAASSTQAIVLVLLLMAPGSGSTGVHNLQSGN